jgi:hypothetical protein
MIKRIDSSASWVMFDAFRGNYKLLADDDDDEAALTSLEFISDGFKINTESWGGINNDGSPYIYAAFA